MNRDICAQLFLSFLSLATKSGQSLSVVDKILPRCLTENLMPKGWPYARKTISTPTLPTYAASLRLFFSIPWASAHFCAGVAKFQGVPQDEFSLSCLLILFIVADCVIFFSSRSCKNVHTHRQWRIQQTTKDRNKPTILVVIIAFNIILFNSF